MLINSSPNRVLQQLRTLEISCFFQESLLLRLCVAGIDLAKAVRQTNRDFFWTVPTQKSTQYLRDSVKLLDRDFGLAHQPMGLADVLFAVANVDDAADVDNWLARPFFPSRKGGGPITTRTAERCLKESCRRCNIEPVITFRDARSIRHLMTSGAPHDQEASKIYLRSEYIGYRSWELVQRIDWFFHQAFRHEHDREDARSETVARLIRHFRLRVENEDAFGKGALSLVLTVARNVHRDYRKRRNESSEVLYFDFSLFSTDESFLESSALDEFRHTIDDECNGLPLQEMKVIRARFGLDRRRGMSVADIGRMLNISSWHVRQLERKAMNRFRARLFQMGPLTSKNKNN